VVDYLHVASHKTTSVCVRHIWVCDAGISIRRTLKVDFEAFVTMSPGMERPASRNLGRQSRLKPHDCTNTVRCNDNHLSVQCFRAFPSPVPNPWIVPICRHWSLHTRGSHPSIVTAAGMTHTVQLGRSTSNKACLLEYLLHIERNDQAYYALSLLLLFKAYMKKLSALNIVRPEVLWSCITPTPELLLETWGNQNFPKALFRQETPGQVRFHQSDLLLVPTSTKNGNRHGQHSRSAWDVVLLHRLPRVH
jgi:hypothetical protein